MSNEYLPPLVEKFQKEVIDKFHPGVKFVWKEDSPLMKFVYYVTFMFLWNKDFLTKFTTVGGGYVWLSKSNWQERTEEEKLRTLIHEGAHMYDTKKNPLNPILNVMPQLGLAIIFVALAFVSPWFLFGLLLAAAPLPAYFRYRTEIRAYRLDCHFVEYVWGWDKGVGLHKHYQDRAVKQMTGSTYYFAWPFEKMIRKDLEVNDTKDPYVIMVFDWLKKEGLLKKPFPRA